MTVQRLRTEIGTLLRLRRRAAAMTQEALAKEAKLSQPLVSKVERGTLAGGFDVVDKLFAVLGLQLRVTAEQLDAHIEAEMAQLMLMPAAERLREWTSELPRLMEHDVVIEGALAALLHGLPVPVDVVDLAITPGAIDGFGRMLDRRGAKRWLPKWQEFAVTGRDADPRRPGPLRWRLGWFELRLRICPALPEWVTIVADDVRVRIRPLIDIEVNDPVIASVLRHYRQLASPEPRGEEQLRR